MRKLNKKQKNLLDKWYNENKDLPGLGVCDIVRDHLPIELLEKLEEINDHETLYQNVNRYVNDKGVQNHNFVKPLW